MLQSAVTRTHSLLLVGSPGVQFRAEFFNLANHANFAMPNVSRSRLFDSAGRIRDAGRITQTTATSRQIQFGVKLVL